MTRNDWDLPTSSKQIFWLILLLGFGLDWGQFFGFPLPKHLTSGHTFNALLLSRTEAVMKLFWEDQMLPIPRYIP